MNAKHLRELIHTTLKFFGYYSPAAVELLMLTAAQESHCGRYLKQLRDGPARGIFQMEPDTMQDIMDNYLSYRPDLLARVNRFSTSGGLVLNLWGNLLFQIVIARVHYLRAPRALPDAEDVSAMARYWKQYWNTEAGAGTVQEAIDNYQRYAA